MHPCSSMVSLKHLSGAEVRTKEGETSRASHNCLNKEYCENKKLFRNLIIFLIKFP